MKSVESIGKSLGIASRSFHIYLDKMLKYHNIELSRGPLLILHFLYDHGPMTQHELSNQLYVDKAAINRTIIKLEQSGYVIKKTCEHDKRKIYLKLTQKALDKQTDISNFLKDIDAKIKEHFTDQEYNNLIYLLNKFIGILDEHDTT